MTLPSTLVCALAAVLLQLPARPQTPPRDVSLPPAVRGTSTITGVVVSADADAKPIRHASVTLVSGNLQLPYITVTDDDGGFEFDNLAAGSYALIASKPGYVATFFGAKSPGKRQGIPIAVGESQRATGVRLALVRGSVITGVVRMQSGGSAVGVSVRVLPLRLENETRRVSDLPTDPQSIGGLTTDDRGRYRAYGLAPGKYVVEVRMDGFNPFSGRLKLTTPEEIQWARQPAATRPPIPTAPVAYAPVYAPSTPNLADAAVITLGPNEERDGVDVVTQFVPVATISGRVLYPDGAPVSGAQISMRAGDLRIMDMVMSMFGGTRTRADGTFELRDVRPGAYTLSVRAFTREDKPPASNSPFGGLSAMSTMFGGSGAKPPTLWASMDVTVDGHDLDSAVLQLQPGLVVSGKLAFDAASMPAPKDLTQYRVMLSPAKPPGSGGAEVALAMMAMGASSASVQADGSFSIAGVTPGRYELKVGGPDLRFNFARRDTGWVLRSAVLRQKDLADSQLAVSPDQDWTGIAVTMTDRPTELSGAMVDKSGRPAPGFPIVVFSADPAQWIAGSRRVQEIRPSTDGTFVLAGLPAGRYYLCALTDLDRSDLASSEFLQSLIPGSIQIALSEGQHLVQPVVLQGR